MITLSFKYVGQGDSIVIHWPTEGKNKAIVIDCNKYQDRNRVIEALEELRPVEVSMLFLSHPHTDHFSGMLELITHCRTNNIPIEYFIHTSGLHYNYLQSVVEGEHAQTLLYDLFEEVDRLGKSGYFKVSHLDAGNPANIVSLDNGYIIRYLSPTTPNEYRKYANRNHLGHNEEIEGNNYLANRLSTVLSLEAPNGDYCLLTSDASKDTLKRIGIKGEIKATGKMRLGQIPHHGALGNHYNSFWRLRDRDQNCLAVVSVGKNQYKHPAKNVIDFFEKNGYQVRSTWNEEIAPKKEAIISAIDSHATLSEKQMKGSDVNFDF